MLYRLILKYEYHHVAGPYFLSNINGATINAEQAHISNCTDNLILAGASSPYENVRYNIQAGRYAIEYYMPCNMGKWVPFEMSDINMGAVTDTLLTI